MPSDLAIARKATLKPIQTIAAAAGVREEELDLYGQTKAKVRLGILDRLKTTSDGKLIVVTAITPTPLGEGKTVTTIGASLGLGRRGQSVFTCLRQPSMGPVFGIKGGAAGGGHSQVVPMEDFNLHLTGDIHAISAAHNLGAAALDSRLYHEERQGYEAFEKRTGIDALKIDPEGIAWRRVVDMNDRALRCIEIGLQSPYADRNLNGVPRKSAFDISSASELMAVLALSRNLADLRKRIGRIVMARTRDGAPVTAEDLRVAGAMTVLLRDALNPTLMQTLEHTPCFVHAGPFANIAHGNSSIVADHIALKLADYVVTEAGFGSDMGFEKFCNIKTPASGKKPSCAVLVTTLRALKMHSGRFRILPGQALEPGLVEENREALESGLVNLDAHIRNVRRHGLPPVVAINRFPTDTKREVEFVRKQALAFGAEAAVVSEVHGKGGEGGLELADAIIAACRKRPSFKTLYGPSASLKEKIETLATTVYEAGRVSYTSLAEEQIARLEKEGHKKLPVCMAKTHLSISHDPELLGAPSRYDFPVREVRVSAGAGFVYVIAGQISTMPGLGSTPAYMNIDIDARGRIKGLF